MVSPSDVHFVRVCIEDGLHGVYPSRDSGRSVVGKRAAREQTNKQEHPVISREKPVSQTAHEGSQFASMIFMLNGHTCDTRLQYLAGKTRQSDGRWLKK